MDLYTFLVESFTISQTRALHQDTLRLATTAYVNGDMVANAYYSLGDFNNGDYNAASFVPAGDVPGLAEVVINDPEAKVAFIFQLVNAGHGTDSSLSGRLAATADQLAGITAGLAGAGATTITAAVGRTAFPAALLLEAFANLWAWLTVDCDGPVAVDQISGPRFVLDAWTDTDDQTVHIYQDYPGSQSADGCDGNSDYALTWSLRHWRSWLPVGNDAGHPMLSDIGLAAAEHHGGLHVFGSARGQLTHARTFTGQIWDVDSIGPFSPALPVSAVSFDDRLYVFAVQADLSISVLAYTVDGGSWQPLAVGPAVFQTHLAVATAVFRNRLCLLARDYGSGVLRITSTADLHIWSPWVDVPPAGLAPSSAVAAAALHGTLYVFGLYQTGKPPENVVVVQNSSTDGVTWSGWDLVEAGIRPDGSSPSDEPLHVAAAISRDRVYLAVPWQSGSGQDATSYLTVNFTADGVNWSGWRIPQSDAQFAPASSPALAAVDGHLYIVSPRSEADASKHIWAY